MYCGDVGRACAVVAVAAVAAVAAVGAPMFFRFVILSSSFFAASWAFFASCMARGKDGAW